VDSIRDEISAGRVYQANLTHRMDLACEAEPHRVYAALRALTPAPFAALLELPELAIISSSPERFLHVDGDRRVESRPIKGTQPRGDTPERDRALEARLRDSQKDAAENLMIVDLVRNDLGRVCATGTIEVPELRRIERYASVFQLVSSVCGDLAEGRDCVDLIRATFPPGSMTGAPKLAAMVILDRIETVRRGVYSGALGYLDLRGGMDLSVVIRTIVQKSGRAYVHAGGGIVADSQPVDEYRESMDKARALLFAIERATLD
jgi:para-aminobenzoate synthetase component 1